MVSNPVALTYQKYFLIFNYTLFCVVLSIQTALLIFNKLVICNDLIKHPREKLALKAF